ncbi:MAG: DUF6644 family protein [Pseudomonadota bacterium]
MNLHAFSDWLSATPFSQAIQVTSWAIPGIQTVHLLGIAILFSSALIVFLRVAGYGLTSETLPVVAQRFISAIWVLLLILLVSGLLLITAEPGRTITNPVFYAKMTMLALVICITLWLARVSRRQQVRPSALHIAVAAFGMLLWIGIIFAGRFIAYVESY